MRITVLNMSDPTNKGDLAILESTITLIKKYTKSVISILNVDYTQKEILSNKNKFKWIERLAVSHYGTFFPNIFRNGRGLKSVLVGAINLINSFVILAIVIFFKERSSKFVFSEHRDSLNAIINADVVVLKGGSYIYSYGGLKQFLFLYRMLYSSIIAVILRKKIIALGHSVGPIVGKLSKTLIRFCFMRFYSIVVREHISMDILKNELNLPISKLELMPDIAFWSENRKKNEHLGINHFLEFENYETVASQKVMVGITVRDWHFPMQGKAFDYRYNYMNTIASFIDKLHVELGADIFFMPHALEDQIITQEIADMAKFSSPIVFSGDYSTSELRQLYGEMDIFIGTRIHSDIFALSSGVPTVAIAYEIPKGFGIISMVEESECIINIAEINLECLWNIAIKLFQEREGREKEIKQRVIILKMQINDLIARLFCNNSFL